MPETMQDTDYEQQLDDLQRMQADQTLVVKLEELIDAAKLKPDLKQRYKLFLTGDDSED